MYFFQSVLLIKPWKINETFELHQKGETVFVNLAHHLVHIMHCLLFIQQSDGVIIIIASYTSYYAHIVTRAMSVERTDIFWCDIRNIVGHRSHLVSTSDSAESPPHSSLS